MSRYSFRSSIFLFTLSFGLLVCLLTRLPALYDADSYYHLAVARLYLQRGFTNSLDWARFSVFREGFGDKEFLFHVFLMPFVALPSPQLGGAIALALLGALVATITAAVATPAVGRSAFLISPLLFITATDFSLRMLRLRPELLSLVLLLAVIALAASGRVVALAAVCAVYALAYTGFHIAVIVVLLFCVWQWLTKGHASWRILAAASVGVGAGLLAHDPPPVVVPVPMLERASPKGQRS